MLKKISQAINVVLLGITTLISLKFIMLGITAKTFSAITAYFLIGVVTFLIGTSFIRKKQIQE